MVNVISVEISPNSRAGCFKCHKILVKGTTRVAFDDTNYGHYGKKYACPECALKEVTEDINFLNSIKRQIQGSFVGDMQISILPDLERNSSDDYEDYKNSEIDSLKKK
jgi:hypothetical protein